MSYSVSHPVLRCSGLQIYAEAECKRNLFILPRREQVFDILPEDIGVPVENGSEKF